VSASTLTRIALARRLRRDIAEAERALWRRLRARGLEGAKFRRQTPVGPFIVDFFCVEARPVVEVVGGQHLGSATDSARDALLAAKGFMVARYWKEYVLANLEGGLSDIAARIVVRPPSPRPSPPGMGERVGPSHGGEGEGANRERVA
jgi:very-short-patch-repair endonuclease